MKEEKGYFEARRLLAERYGQPYKIAMSYVDLVLNGRPIRSEDAKALQEFSTQLTSCCNTLREVGYLHSLDNPGSLRKIVERLPYGLRVRWREVVDAISQKEAREVNLDDLKVFVEAKSRVANHPIFGKITTDPKESSIHQRHSQRPVKGFATQGKPRQPTKELECPSCKGNHWLSQCDDFKKLRLNDRRQLVNQRRLCINCLTKGHFVKDCPKRSFCRVQGCLRKHSTFLHEKEQNEVAAANESGNEVSSNATADATPEQVNNGCVQRQSFNISYKSTVVGMSVVPVKVRVKGQEDQVLTYAFLDSGSNTSFCTQSLLKKLHSTGEKTTLSLSTLQNANATVESSMVSLELTDIKNRNLAELPVVYSCSSLPLSKDTIGTQDDVRRWPHLKGIKIPSIEAEIGLLIGSDAPLILQPREVRESENGGPFATRTLFGWVLNGPLGRENPKVPIVNVIVCRNDLTQQFKDFCNLEFNDSSYEPKVSMSQNDRYALNIMDSTAKLTLGHYEVGLPWKNEPPRLEDNKSLALYRLNLLKVRLKRDDTLLRKYASFMDDLTIKNYATKVSNDDFPPDKGKWYLPHHPVFHPHKPDKVRVVFDCSAKYHGSSLNDQLLQGPDLTNTLVGVLLRFREEQIAFMSDIEAMFYQVRVPPKDSNYLRFLWWPEGNLDSEPEEYKMLVHLFGGTSSPSCANYALKKTAKDNSEEFDSVTVETVLHNFYVDDCLKSVATEAEAVHLASELSTLLQRGGFHLTKWISNSRTVIDSIPESERAPTVKDLDFDNHSATERALGVRWNVHGDTFGYKIVKKEKPTTRRGLLSIISSVYDPLGFASPYILLAKIILQDLCQRNLGWDDQVPELHKQRWEEWLKDLPRLEEFQIPRCLRSRDVDKIHRNELHHFSDSSSKGYGAVSYLRKIDSSGNVHCSIVMAKSRLAPLKTMTIPRMELSAAVLATRLDKMIKQELTLDVGESIFWTDSTCVLRYIENKDKRFQVFVANRVAAIMDQTSANQWRYVETSLNPADEASRGMTAAELLSNERWIKGPTFLYGEENSWPQRPSNLGEVSQDDPEVKKVADAFASDVNKEKNCTDEMLERFSSWTRLKNTVAWLLRLKHNLLQRIRSKAAERAGRHFPNAVETGPLSVSEVSKAEKCIVEYVQRQYFTDEFQCLGHQNTDADRQDSSNTVKKQSSLYKLDPILENGLIKVGGRLEQAHIASSAKHPIILPRKHHIVNLIINYYHRACGHSGVEYTLSLVRQKFWIIRARCTVRNVLNSCYDCRRRQAPAMQQKMASLPVSRTTPSEPPFTFVGVDCFGPFTVRRGRTTAKRYGVLFTCLAIRAIHIEIVYSMDSESFINALRRFIARRGHPQQIISDNGGNFVKAERELRKAIQNWNQDQIHHYLLSNGVKWIFNPPAASHHGGVWERCIRTVRKVIKALTKQQVLDDEGLSTLMCEVESIVNGRPITKVSDDPKDLEALTPNHLLLLRAGNSLPPGIFSKEDNFSRRRWRQVQYLSNIFWLRWKREYLPSLQQRQKWNKQQRNIAINDIVLLLDENTPRNVWPLGRVIEVYHNSQDNLVRSAKVKTRTSEYVRPVDKIILLEAAHIEKDKEMEMKV